MSTTRYEEFFDPERLRPLWQREAETAATEGAPAEGSAAAPAPAVVVLERLSLTLERELGPEAKTLESFVLRVRELFETLDSPETTAEAQSSARAELPEAIDRIEDLFEALELGVTARG